jgi:RND family efflux transporter MFP subunit
VIDEVNVKVGEYAAPGLGVFRLVNTNNVKVTAKIADSYIRNLKIGDKVNVTFNDLGETVEGKISFISKVVNPMSRTFAIEVLLDKNTADIRPNMMASLSINDQIIDSIASVPSNMIQKDAAGRLYIMVAEKDGNAFVARKKQVKPGISYGAFTVIEEGLSGNEKIVTSAYQEIVDGQPISIN